MQRRTKLIGLILLVLIALLLLILLFMRFRPEEQAPEQQAPVEDTTPEPTAPVVERPVEPFIADDSRNTTSSIQSLAKTFAERYGSFSNQSNYENLRDILPLMTQTFQEQTINFIRTAEEPEGYYAVTTKVVSVEVTALDEEEGIASATLTTQREEAIGAPQNISVRYQSLELDFVKQGDTWFISNATWVE